MKTYNRAELEVLELEITELERIALHDEYSSKSRQAKQRLKALLLDKARLLSSLERILKD